MTFSVEIVLKGRDFAVTETLEAGGASWNDTSVHEILVQILRAIGRAEDPAGAAGRDVVLQGFSWIVEPVAGSAGEVVIAIEIPMGAAVAGPFTVSQVELDALITRVIRNERKDRMGTVH